MDLDLTPASIELLSKPKPIFLNGDIILFLQTIWYVKRILYIAMLCVCVCVCVCFVSFTMKCCQESGLLFISMLKVIQIFAVLYFHMFDKMTKRRIKKKKQRWPCSCWGKKKEE